MVNLVVGIITYISLAANFGKSAGFAIGMIFLPIEFFSNAGVRRCQICNYCGLRVIMEPDSP
ncbi:MAG: DUF5684 domain-containing protein [bacterium]